MVPEKQGLERWVNTDPALHFNGPIIRQPDWRWEYVGLLQGREYGKAEELRRSKSNE